MALEVAVTYDQLDISNLACGEVLARLFFPLVKLAVECRPSRHLSRKVKQRVGRRLFLTTQCGETVDALNALAGYTGRMVTGLSEMGEQSRVVWTRLWQLHARVMFSGEECAIHEALVALLGRAPS
eukprot:5133672-Amphidinium_carterae.1